MVREREGPYFVGPNPRHIEPNSEFGGLVTKAGKEYMKLPESKDESSRPRKWDPGGKLYFIVF